MPLINGQLVVVRGAGDLATGCIVRLVRAGFRVAVLETARPSSIRRTVCLSEAMYEGKAEVEGVRAVRVDSLEEMQAALTRPGPVPLLEDPGCTVLARLRPVALVDAIIAKRNLGTRIGMAEVVVALGPGFEAGVDADAVVETNRGHDLGRVLLSGRAEPDTGVPGLIAGHGGDRVLHAPIAGVVQNLKRIGDPVRAGEPVLALIGEEGRVPLAATIDGMLRGLIRPGFQAHAGLKVADVDPRGRREHCFTISDKGLAVAGGVLEAVLMLGARP
ncbi:MAG: selenium-dependent molybdenum cofactor biosynthesis protein YqeB [Holophaga sp.]|nr:selenium-dependent molybdenum cofactor biosynthesis protein YqeB [Holophaga sp.]